MYNKFSLELTQQMNINVPKDDIQELSPLYHYIVDLSKDSPIYLINETQANQDLALNIKTSALNIYDVLQNFLCDEDDLPSCIQNFTLTSNIPDVVDVNLLPGATSCPNYTIKIDKIATGQLNKSMLCTHSKCKLAAGTYSFYIETSNQRNEFEIEIHSDCTNDSVLKRIAKLLNSTCVDLIANVNESKDKVWLEITAIPNRRDVPAAFSISDIESSDKHSTLTEYFKLNHIEQKPTQTYFEVNGESIHSFGTAFILDEYVELTILKDSEETIYLTKEIDYENALELIHRFIESLNHLIMCSNQKGGKKLFHKLNSIIASYEEQLEFLGIFIADDNSLCIENNLFKDSLKDANVLSLFQEEDSIISILFHCAKEITINPMEYIQKKVVAYPNTKETHYPNPYITSSYTGFLFSSYC